MQGCGAANRLATSSHSFLDATAAAAVIDRVVHHAIVLKTDGESFRLRAAKTKAARRTSISGANASGDRELDRERESRWRATFRGPCATTCEDDGALRDDSMCDQPSMQGSPMTKLRVLVAIRRPVRRKAVASPAGSGAVRRANTCDRARANRAVLRTLRP